MEFWIAVDGESYGPYEPDQVQQLVQGGQLAPDAEIWFPDREAWVPAQYLVGFVPAPQLAMAAASAATATGPAYEAATEPTYAAPSGVPQEWVEQADQGYATQPAPVTGRTNPWAIAALVVGILALGVSWLPLFNVVSLAGAVLGLVLVLLALVWIRKGAGGKGMALGALVLCALAAAISVLVSTMFVNAVDGAAEDLAQAVAEQPADAVLVTLGAPRWDGTSTILRARVTNTSTAAVSGGSFTVQAVARNGTLVDQTSGAVPALGAGQAAPVQVVFVKRIPPGATVSVTGVSTYAS